MTPSSEKTLQTHDWISNHAGALLTIIIVGIFILAIGLRLFDLTDQPIDFHPTRQLRNAVVARGIYYQLLPDADENLRSKAIAYGGSTGQYEPPVLESIVARTYLLIGEETLWVSRIYTTFFWIIAGLALFDLARRMAQPREDIEKEGQTKQTVIPLISALIATTYYLILPFSVQASRSFQPDPGMVMGIVLSVYALYRWSERPSWKWALLAGVLGGFAILLKIVAAYIIAGAAIALVLHNSLRSNKKLSSLLKSLANPQIWMMVILMLAPTIIYYFTRSERSSEYFSNWTLALSHLLLDPWFYVRWLNTIRKLMGILPLLLSLGGLILSRSRTRALLLGLWFGYFAYGFFVPYQMYTHSYYHLQLVPIVALSLVPIIQFGLERLSSILSSRSSPQRNVVIACLTLLTLATIAYFSWQALIPLYNRDYRNEPDYWQEIAAQLPDDGKIMALTQDYGYRLMYYGWRKVTLWPNRGERKLIEMRGSGKTFEELFAERSEGKSYFLVTSFNQFNDQPMIKKTLYDNYPIVAETKGYVIFDLRQSKSP